MNYSNFIILFSYNANSRACVKYCSNWKHIVALFKVSEDIYQVCFNENFVRAMFIQTKKIEFEQL